LIPHFEDSGDKAMSRSVSFAHKETGLFNGMHMMFSDDALVVLNTPPDHFAVDGQFDSLSQRVDIATGKVIDYQPPSPSADHEWSATTKRWKLNAAAQSKINNHNSAMSQILTLEATQHRAVRELALGVTDAQQRLADIDAQITTLRGGLRETRC
jgi:hypothetical protein